MAKVLLLCVISMFAVMIPVLIDRYRLERLRYEFEELRQEVEYRSPDPQLVPRKGRMKNFEFLFAAWMVVWAVFLGLRAVRRAPPVAVSRRYRASEAATSRRASVSP